MFTPVAKAEHIRFKKDMFFTSPKQYKDAILIMQLMEVGVYGL